MQIDSFFTFSTHIPIKCHNFINDSFFIKNLRENNKTCKNIVLFANKTLEPSIVEHIHTLLSEELDFFLVRKFLHETQNSYIVNYEFTSKGIFYFEKMDLETIKKILLVLDCLDIKPLMIAILGFVVDKKLASTDKLIEEMRKDRFTAQASYG